LLRRPWTLGITLVVVTALIYGIICLAPLESRVRLYMGKRTRAEPLPDIENRMIQTIIREHGLD
jgi:hypothetical protein